MQDRLGAVVERLKGWNQAALTDQTRGVEHSSAGRSVLELCLGKEGVETCKVLENILTWCQLKVHHFAKIHLARQFVHQKLPQPGKDQCLSSAVL